MTPVLLYDAGCGFCDGVVAFVRRRDRAGTLRFVPLDSAFADAVRRRHPGLAAVDSIVWVEADGDRVLTRSGAALRVARHLGGGWRLLSGALRLVPRALRDAAYDAVARRRCDITTAVRRRTAPPAAPGA